MDEINNFTDGQVKQPALRTCISTNSVTNNGTPLSDSNASLGRFPSSGSENNTYVEDVNCHSKLSQTISQNSDEDVNENNYISSAASSNTNCSNMSEQETQASGHEKDIAVDKSISVAELLQHGTEEEPLQRNGNIFSESNEEGYDSEDEEEINDAKLLEFMLRDSKSQEDFHHQYDELTSALQVKPEEKIQTESKPLSEINLPTRLNNENSVGLRSDDSSQAEKQCWVCFASEEDDTSAMWTAPCRCRGTTKWAHQACIQRWVDEKQKGNNMASVECPQCGTKYSIRFPDGSFLVSLLDSSEVLIHRVCPIVAGGVCIGSLYWTCVTFGAVTLMQTLGQNRCLIVMERADPLFLLVSLPLIPVGLVLGKMIRWEEPVLKSLRRYVPLIPLSRYILPAFYNTPERQSLQTSLPPLSDPVSVTRTFCGALFFPTIAAFLGATLFENVPSQLKRTLLGGVTFVFVKGVLKIYHKQHNYIRQCERKILDYKESV